jgi:Flp pilus assembly protein TadG
MFMVTRNLRRWRDRGAAAVEFALVVPVLILLIFGSIEFGLAVQARTMIGNAAREGVRVASLGGTVADVSAHAIGALGPLSGSNPQVAFTCVTSGNSSCNPNAPGKNSVATVVVTVNYTGITGMFPQLTNTTLTATSVMRIEN